MENELQGYMNDADNGGGDEGPGAAPGEPVPAALEVLTDMAPIMAKPIRDPCPDGVDCISDREALWVELRAIDLINQLAEAEKKGVWVRNWQTCLTMGVKFRIEMSLQRVEFVCGLNVELSRRARTIQSIGLEYVDRGEYLGARILQRARATVSQIEAYNDCIVPFIYEDDAGGNPTVPLVAFGDAAVMNLCKPAEGLMSLPSVVTVKSKTAGLR